MTIDQLIIFAVFSLSYGLTLKFFRDRNIVLKEMVVKKRHRVVIILLMFCVTVFFQVKFSESRNLAFHSLMYAFVHGMCLSTLTRFIWGRGLA